MQGASLRERIPPPATLAHKEERNKMLKMRRTEWSTILGSNGRLPNAKSSMLQDNNSDAA